MKVVLLSGLAAGCLSITSCTARNYKTPKPQGGTVSNLTSISISMPDKRPLAVSAPQIETLMNAYVLVAELLTPGCQAGAQRIEEFGDYNQGVSQASLFQGCDYGVTLGFGSRDPGARNLKATYLKNNAPHVIRKEETAGKAEIAATIAVQIQPDGAAIGLRPPATGSPPPAATSTPSIPAPPTVPSVNLSTDKNLPLRGFNGSTTLAQVFKGDYTIVDLSAVSCTFCIERARELAQNIRLQRLLNGGKCSRITLIDDLNGWSGLGFGPASFIGAQSYEVGMSATAAGRRLGVQINGTPYFVILDRNGNVQPNDDPNSEPITFIEAKCQ